MYSNIGGKIKALAMVVCGIGAFISVVYGIYLIVNYSTGAEIDYRVLLVGLIIIIIGVLLSWTGSFVLYGFGQLVQNSDRLVKHAEQLLALQKSCKDASDPLAEETASKKDNP